MGKRYIFMYFMKNYVKRKHLKKTVPYISAFRFLCGSCKMENSPENNCFFLNTVCSYFKRTRVVQAKFPSENSEEVP